MKQNKYTFQAPPLSQNIVEAALQPPLYKLLLDAYRDHVLAPKETKNSKN